MSTRQYPQARTYAPGADITTEASAAVVGRRLVHVSGDRGQHIRIAHAESGGPVFGVAKYDAESGELVGVARGGIVLVTAESAVVAGAGVEVGSAGQVVPHTDGVLVGHAVANASAGGVAEIALV